MCSKIASFTKNNLLYMVDIQINHKNIFFFILLLSTLYVLKIGYLARNILCVETLTLQTHDAEKRKHFKASHFYITCTASCKNIIFLEKLFAHLDVILLRSHQLKHWKPLNI